MGLWAVLFAVFLFAAAVLIGANLLAAAVARALRKGRPTAPPTWQAHALSHLGSVALAVPACAVCYVVLLVSGPWLGIQNTPGPPAPGFSGPPWWYTLACLHLAALAALAVSIGVYFVLLQRFQKSAARRIAKPPPS